MKKSVLFILFLFLVLSSSSAAVNSAEPLHLPPGIPVVASPSEPAPVLRALDDLRRDLQWVLGTPSPRLDHLPADPDAPGIVVTCQQPDTAGLRDRALSGPEAHAVLARGNRVVLQGGDARGTIYATGLERRRGRFSI